jgi:hypothetical protein
MINFIASNTIVALLIFLLVIGIVYASIGWWQRYDQEMQIHPERARKKEYTAKQLDKIKSREYMAGYNDALVDVNEMTKHRENI